MDRFYIIPNSAKDPELTFSNRIIAYLEKHGARCHVQKITEKMEGPYHYTDPDGIPQDTQCIIVLGGDGTLLQAARDVVHLDIPLLGINLGNLGFLAEVNQTSLYSALDQLMADDYEVEERMMLEGRVLKDSGVSCGIKEEIPDALEITVRENENEKYYIYQNFGTEAVSIPVPEGEISWIYGNGSDKLKVYGLAVAKVIV